MKMSNGIEAEHHLEWLEYKRNKAKVEKEVAILELELLELED